MICKVCGAIIMEGSPYCPNCNSSMEESEKKTKINVDTLNKGTMSGDVVLSDNKRVVLASKDNENISDETTYQAPKEEFVKKKYSLRQEDIDETKMLRQAIDLDDNKFDYTDDQEIFENANGNQQVMPKWKVKQEKLKQKKNIKSAHPIGTVQGGEIFPEGMSWDEFLKLQKMSKLRSLYYWSIVLLYIGSILEVVFNVLWKIPSECLIGILLVMVCTLIFQKKNSLTAALFLIVFSLLYVVFMYFIVKLPMGFVLVFASLIAFGSTKYIERLYSNYLVTQTVPNKLSDVFKI